MADGPAHVAAWAFIALVAQLVAYALVALLLKEFPKRIPALFNFEAFRPELKQAAPRSDGSKGGRRLSITC